MASIFCFNGTMKVCINDIWAKDTQTPEEIKLTAEKELSRAKPIAGRQNAGLYLRT